MKTIRTHRVGTITCGISLILMGILFIINMFYHLGFRLIFRLWPLVLIGVGIELMMTLKKENEFVYDKAAVFLLITLCFFAMCMAGADLVLTGLGNEMHITY